VIPLCRTEAPSLVDLGDGKVACHVAVARERAGQPTPGRLERVPTGTVFHERGGDGAVPATAGTEVLRFDGVTKTYRRRRGFRVSTVEAVADVSFSLSRGRVTALVGQSGSGKSTIARLLTRIESPDAGTVSFGAIRVDGLRGAGLRDYRKHVQMVFQDPFAALNPASTVLQTLLRPLINHRGLSAAEARAKARELLERVGLTPADRFAEQRPHQLSGGQRQRVVIARALAPEPEIIVADEPISMLDVSIRAEILGLLEALVRERGIAMLYITHDLLSARLLADEILVLNHGKVVERGPAKEVITRPSDPYTQLLLRSIPNPFHTVRSA
jgi:peptide/nickel transport system ATP-binding protein